MHLTTWGAKADRLRIIGPTELLSEILPPKTTTIQKQQQQQKKGRKDPIKGWNMELERSQKMKCKWMRNNFFFNAQHF